MNAELNITASIEEEASLALAERVQGLWTQEQEASLTARLATDASFAAAYARMQRTWESLDAYAESPEIMRQREAALMVARRTSARRWSLATPGARRRWRQLAAAAGFLIVLGIGWQLSPYGYAPGTYHTNLGEQKTVELDDHSRIVLDAVTRLRVRYTADARVIELQGGQAQFTVTHDPSRPFKVLAGDRAIVAVGTVFTVEYADQKVHVATLEGRVAVMSGGTHTQLLQAVNRNSALAASIPTAIEVSAGEELRAVVGGAATVIPQADLEAATAWRQGKIIFRTESLGDAVRRMNRYSHVEIQVPDADLAAQRISGVFEAGDAQGFVDAVERYLNVSAESPEPDHIVLSPKRTD